MENMIALCETCSAGVTGCGPSTGGSGGPSSSKYKMFDAQNRTWTENKAFCEQNGAKLATIHSAAEEQDARTVISNFSASPPISKASIGAKTVSGKWVWDDGSDWTYDNI